MALRSAWPRVRATRGPPPQRMRDTRATAHRVLHSNLVRANASVCSFGGRTRFRADRGEPGRKVLLKTIGSSGAEAPSRPPANDWLFSPLFSLRLSPVAPLTISSIQSPRPRVSGVGRDSGWTVTRSGRATPSSRLGYHRFAQRRVSTGSIGRSVPLRRGVSPSSRLESYEATVWPTGLSLRRVSRTRERDRREGHVVGSELRDPPSRHSSPRSTAPASVHEAERERTGDEAAARTRSRATHDTCVPSIPCACRTTVNSRSCARRESHTGLAPSVNSVTRREREREHLSPLPVRHISLCLFFVSRRLLRGAPHASRVDDNVDRAGPPKR